MASLRVQVSGEAYAHAGTLSHPVASAHQGTDAATSPARVTTLELLAKELF